jgi:glucose-1-phosphate cytidylyltransferase
MKTVIFAGGMGTRISEESVLKPKPMIEIGGKPILWHIMKIYAHYGINEFVLCLGYKGNIIKDYFYHFNSNNSDFTVDLCNDDIIFHNKNRIELWKVTLVDTGLDTLKGARIKRIEQYLDDDLNCLTYGDGVSNVHINKLIEFHKSHGKLITITGVKPPSMFGEIIEEDGKVLSFEEKPQTSKGLINGGYMVFHRKMLDYLSTDKNCDFEFGPLEKMAKEGQVMTYKHNGFWECADTLRDLENLNKLWMNNQAAWKVWDD